LITTEEATEHARQEEHGPRHRQSPSTIKLRPTAHISPSPSPQPHLWQRLLARQPVEEGEAGAARNEVLRRFAVLVVHCRSTNPLPVSWMMVAGAEVGGTQL
jgi:hypothetical protein